MNLQRHTIIAPSPQFTTYHYHKSTVHRAHSVVLVFDKHRRSCIRHYSVVKESNPLLMAPLSSLSRVIFSSYPNTFPSLNSPTHPSLPHTGWHLISLRLVSFLERLFPQVPNTAHLTEARPKKKKRYFFVKKIKNKNRNKNTIGEMLAVAFPSWKFILPICIGKLCCSMLAT